jgi:hypothetical protein
MNARGAVRTATAIGAVIVVGIVGYNVFQALPGAGTVTDEWTTYPGSYFVTTEEVLGALSLEETIADGDAVMEQLQLELADYGFEWTEYLESTQSRSSNGYGGDSMLYRYTSEVLVGESQVTDDDAREQIIEIFDRVMSARPTTTVVVDNDEIDDDDAVYSFGSADRESQALWSAWSYPELFNGLQADISVFDSTVPVDDGFGSSFWVDEDATGTLFVRLRVSASNLLAEADREEFLIAVEPYEGKTKPEYRD